MITSLLLPIHYNAAVIYSHSVSYRDWQAESSGQEIDSISNSKWESTVEGRSSSTKWPWHMMSFDANIHYD